MTHGTHWVHWLALVAILALAAWLRLHRVVETPGWYSDEGTHLEIARHLLEGRHQYFAIGQSTLLVARLPLFEHLLAGAMQVDGPDMQTLRSLTGALGVLSVGLLYFVTRLTMHARLALLAALLLAIYPQAVLYSRFGFSYNLLVPLVLLVCVGLLKYRATLSRRWLALAALGVGIGLTSDLMMGAFVLPVLIVVGLRCARDLLWTLPLMGLPIALYAAVMLASAPDAFLFDLGYTVTRLGGKPILQQMTDLATNYTVLLSQDFWLLAGLIGLFLLPAGVRLVALLLLLLPIVLLGRTVALYSLSAYYMIPLLPLIALGAARFVERAAVFVNGANMNQRLLRGLVLLLVFAPLLTVSVDMLHKINQHYPTAIDLFLLDPQAVRAVAAYVNGQTSPDDTVIASPGIGWAFNADTADFQMTVAFDGQATPHLPADIPRERFVFSPRYQQARFVVVDNLWRNWGAVHIPALATILTEIASWPLVFEAGAIQVYENPAYVTTGIPRSDAPRFEVVASG